MKIIIFLLILSYSVFSTWTPGNKIKNKISKIKRNKQRKLFIDALKSMVGMETSAEKATRARLDIEIPQKKIVEQNKIQELQDLKLRLDADLTSLETTMTLLNENVKGDIEDMDMLASNSKE